MRFFRFLILIPFLFISSAYSAPEPLVIDKTVKKRFKDQSIISVHKEMIPASKNIDAIRYAILQGMVTTRGYAWVYEGEGDGYILARFDYRGDTNVMRIEYNKDMVQLKYHRGFGDFVCKRNINDICYRNKRGYYNYFRHLRDSINEQLSMI